MFEAHHHARMLADATRLTAFYDAMVEVLADSDRVLDAGTGTGILAAMASQLTAGTVIGVEYLKDTAAFAKQALQASHLDRVEVVQGNAAQADIGTPPDVVVSETIGALGPEENIVGLTHALRQRYPGIRAFIPSRLRVLAEPVVSAEADALRASILGTFMREQPGGLSFTSVLPQAEYALGTQIVTASLSDTTSAGPARTLVEYDLGTTPEADFSQTLFIGDSPANAVHLYFEASLSPAVTLSSHRAAAFTHWGHSYIVRPSNASAVTIGYHHSDRRFTCHWYSTTASDEPHAMSAAADGTNVTHAAEPLTV
ncbi:methyltransferase domain-containing protein [Streptomyces sp. G-G2]|uniref:methyltransferase domain-containing protein n=1 Tax=Streptomyces sp. G-G2 TaxID=3046201 RepID=UPI0024BB9C8B|nr:methyltransferase domain-containing protein [Streptomyces sp. G-G2]MDJ0386091.1 methyltransferase domain-containing protein [Streptomyces sp. G-G2]